MRREARIRVRTKDIEAIRYIYDAIKNKINKDLGIYSGGFVVELYEDTEEYIYLMNEIRINNLEFGFSEGREYTKKEMNSAKYYYTSFIYPYQGDPKDAIDFGTKYDDSTGCQKCGRGKKQISELRIDLKKLKKYPIATMAPEIFIRSEVKVLLEQNEVSGIHFGEVKDYKNRETITYYQLFIDNIMPPMSDKVRVEYEDISKCKLCGFGGIYPRSEFIYNSKDISVMKDFNYTYEYIWAYGLREVIISSKVRDIFQKFKCRVGYEPIAFIKG